MQTDLQCSFVNKYHERRHYHFEIGKGDDHAKAKRLHRSMVTAIVTSSMLLLSACSIVEQANQSLSYVSGATDYINQVSSAGTELQQLAADAVNNPNITDQIQEKIDLIQAEAAEFSEMSAPAIGENIHENLVSYNNQLTEVINHSKLPLRSKALPPRIGKNRHSRINQQH